MITGWDIYWITRLDYLHNTMETMFTLSIIIAVLCTFVLLIWSVCDEDPKIIKKYVRYPVMVMVFAAVVSFLYCFFPSTKEAIAIYAVPKIVANEDVQQIPENAARFINTKLQEWVGENIETETE